MPKPAIELRHDNVMRKRDIFLMATWGVPIAIFSILVSQKIPAFWVFLYMTLFGAIFYVKKQDYDAQLEEIELFLFEDEQERVRLMLEKQPSFDSTLGKPKQPKT